MRFLWLSGLNYNLVHDLRPSAAVVLDVGNNMIIVKCLGIGEAFNLRGLV